MGKRRFSRIALAWALAALLFQSTACVKKQVVIPSAEAPSPTPSSKPENAGTAKPLQNPGPVHKQDKPGPYLISDLWFGNTLVQSPEAKGAFTDPETYRAERLADFNAFLSDDCSTKTPPLKGFDRFLNDLWEDAGKYFLVGAGLVGYLEARHHH